MLDISDISSSLPTFLIEAYSSPHLSLIQNSFFPRQISNQEPQTPFRKLYSASKKEDALLLTTTLCLNRL